jgi:hypothetical protein
MKAGFSKGFGGGNMKGFIRSKNIKVREVR